MTTPIPITHYKINSISRIYIYYNQFFTPNREKEFTNFKLNYGNVNKYRLIGIIGSGKYSLVFLGHCKNGFCAVKVLKSVQFEKIQKELYIMSRLQSIKSVVQLYDIIKDNLTGTISIVTQYFRFDNPKTLYPQLTIDDIRYYMYLLIHTIDRCHSKGIMHRDIKPGNVLINHQNKTISIIDWGLADLYYPMKQYSVKVSTMRYKAPELLIGYHFYDYGVDIWGIGCILAEMLFGNTFIKGLVYEEVLESIAKIWGKKPILDFSEKYGIEILPSFMEKIDHCTNSEWNTWIKTLALEFRNEHLIDLLKKLLEVDLGERITAREALTHPFFIPLFE